MNWKELLTIAQNAPVFPSSLLLAGRGSANDVRRQLDRWVKSGRLLQLRRGVYAVAPPHYGMIPEFVPTTTSVTMSRPEELQTPLGHFLFRHVKKSAFFGYAQTEISRGQPVFLASPEKALLDLLYLTPGSDSPAYLEELRFEPTDHFDWQALQMNAERIGSCKLKRGLKLILRLTGVKNPEELPR
jgi:predicted transcriptional regulator of viral defense system